MRIETGSRVVTLVVALLSAFSIGTYLFSNRSLETLRRAEQRYYELSQALYLYGQNSALLTTAARTYIVTGDAFFRRTFDARIEAGWPDAIRNNFV